MFRSKSLESKDRPSQLSRGWRSMRYFIKNSETYTSLRDLLKKPVCILCFTLYLIEKLRVLRVYATGTAQGLKQALERVYSSYAPRGYRYIASNCLMYRYHC